MMISANDKTEITQLLIKSEIWDNFLGKKYPSVKRYGGEGAESLLAFFSEIFKVSAKGIQFIHNINLMSMF